MTSNLHCSKANTTLGLLRMVISIVFPLRVWVTEAPIRISMLPFLEYGRGFKRKNIASCKYINIEFILVSTKMLPLPITYHVMAL